MKEIVKYKWNYFAHQDGDKFIFKVIPNFKIEVPTTLFKLYNVSDLNVEALLNQYVYATHPCQFNDIYDCSEELLNFDDKEFNKSFLKEYTSLNDEQIDDFISNQLTKSSIHVQRNFREIIYKNFGLLSMTSNPNSILMWSYYTNHNGFFLEFDYEKFPFIVHGPFPINYLEKVESISIKEVGIELGLLLQSNLKFKDWQHESEWRFLIESKEMMISPSFEELKKYGGHDRKFNYPIEAIKSIGLGNRFFEPEEIRIIDDETLSINIRPKNKNKILILDFIASKQLFFYSTQRDGLFNISFAKVKLKKTGKYSFTQTKKD